MSNIMKVETSSTSSSCTAMVMIDGVGVTEMRQANGRGQWGHPATQGTSSRGSRGRPRNEQMTCARIGRFRIVVHRVTTAATTTDGRVGVVLLIAHGDSTVRATELTTGLDHRL
jgi:hypothetical protein